MRWMRISAVPGGIVTITGDPGHVAGGDSAPIAGSIAFDQVASDRTETGMIAFAARQQVDGADAEE